MRVWQHPHTQTPFQHVPILVCAALATTPPAITRIPIGLLQKGEAAPTSSFKGVTILILTSIVMNGMIDAEKHDNSRDSICDEEGETGHVVQSRFSVEFVGFITMIAGHSLPIGLQILGESLAVRYICQPMPA
jgi:hypothetical protein